MVRIRNATLRRVLRPTWDRMSKPQTVASSCCTGNEAVPDQVSVSENSAHGGTGKTQQGPTREQSPNTLPCRTKNTSMTMSYAKTTTRESSSADFIPFSLYSHLLQGRQPSQHTWPGAPCYMHQPSPPTLSGHALTASCTGAAAHFSVSPNQSARSYSSHIATQPILKTPKPEAYEIYPSEDNIDRDLCDRENSRITVTDPRVLPREWEYTAFGKAHLSQPKSGVELTVLSYNILSQSLLEDNSFLYPHCSSDVLDWDRRRTILLEELLSYQPDVLCLQEVQADHYTNYFLPQLSSAGYEGVYQKRTGDKPDGCAIFVNRKKLTISKAFPIIYNRGDILDRDNIALIVHLKSATNNPRKQADVFVATTHLLFNPRRGDVKLAQLSVLLAELDRLANRGSLPGGFPGYAPVILCGDFNTEPHSDIYKFVVRGYLRYEGLLCRQLSGQKERHFGRDVYLSNRLLHPNLGITDQCQYVRNLHLRKIPVPDYIQEATADSNRPDGSRRTTDFASPSSPTDSAGPPWGVRGSVRPGHRNVPEVSQGMGCLWHKVNFVSVYNHTIQRLGHTSNEITTQHEHASCTLDYIFYNVRRKRTHTHRNRVRLQNVEEDKLCLIGRYGLLSAQEIAQLGGLPNKYLGSDHLGLLAKFLLKYS